MAALKSKATGKKASKKAVAKVAGGKSVKGKAAAVKPAVVKTARKKAAKATVANATANGTAKPTKAAPASAGPSAKMVSKKVAKAVPSVPTVKVGKLAPTNPVATDGPALTVGDAVPAFEALDQTGARVTSASLAGVPYVIYFYPKDDTPGCTTEACGFRDEMAMFAERGVKVLGVSPDSSASHARFAQKYGLEFTLLADTEKKLVTLFGVWKLKQNYGREYWGVERSTFVVDARGKIAKQWRGVKVAGHLPAVLAAVGQL